jgi:hypothetical protein
MQIEGDSILGLGSSSGNVEIASSGGNVLLDATTDIEVDAVGIAKIEGATVDIDSLTGAVSIDAQTDLNLTALGYLYLTSLGYIEASAVEDVLIQSSGNTVQLISADNTQVALSNGTAIGSPRWRVQALNPLGGSQTSGIFRAEGTIRVMDGNDTTYGINFDMDNATHSGSNNIFSALYFDSIVGSPNATEAAIEVESGWDTAVRLPASQEEFLDALGYVWLRSEEQFGIVANIDNVSIISNQGGVQLQSTISGAIAHLDVTAPPAAVASSLNGIIRTRLQNLNAMNGSDTVYFERQNIVNGNHTGSNNFLYAKFYDLDTADAQADETAVLYDANWDYDWRSEGTAFANLGTPANGTFVYCSDCTEADPCASGGNGALAQRLNGRWDCN